MPAYLCVTCGVQFTPGDTPPPGCPICEDERQYVGHGGQRWTTIEEMAAAGHRNDIVEEEPGLTSIGTEPRFAIAQRALLVQTPAGNLLWDCITYLDDATVEAVRARGGVAAVAVSHPHYYSSVVEWSRAFGDAPIFIHAADRRWVMRPEGNYTFWAGDTAEPVPGLRLHRLGGHFPGGTVCHWPAGSGGRGALLSGDILQVVPDRRFVSFMYSYPNLIPLPAETVARIAAAVRPLRFDRVYGAWRPNRILDGAADAVQRSAERYIAALNTPRE